VTVAAHPPSPLRLFASVSRVHIIAIAALGTLTFGWLFTGRYLVGVTAVSALDWFLVNLLNRVVDVPEDKANGIVGTDFIERNASVVRVVGFGVLGASLLLVGIVLPQLMLLRIAFHSLGLLYNWPLLPGGARIKELYVLKNVASATGFLLTCFGYPLAATGSRLAPGIGWLTIGLSAAFFFCFELSYEVIYDLRDARGDAAAGIRTFPVVHGENATVRIVDGLCIAATMALVFGYAGRALPWRIVVMVVAPLMQVILYKRWLARGITSADCVRLTWIGAGLLVAYHAWVLAGLPGVED
jgi:4-hydroxybenzoate polyprenyltransferase